MLFIKIIHISPHKCCHTNLIDCLSVSLFFCLFAYLSIYLSLYLSLSLSNLSTCLFVTTDSICLFMCLFICLSVLLYVCISVYMSVCVFVYLSVYLFASLSVYYIKIMLQSSFYKPRIYVFHISLTKIHFIKWFLKLLH